LLIGRPIGWRLGCGGERFGMRLARRAWLVALAPFAASAQGFSPSQRAEIVEILREALRADPSILREAQEAGGAAIEQERAGAVRAAIRAQAAALFDDPADPVLGDRRAPIGIVEFADPRCGFCKQLHPVRQELLRRHPDVRVVMKDLAILGPLSFPAARALLAAHRQGRYAALHDALFRLREEPVEAVLRREAERVGCDWTRLRREMDDPAIGRRLEMNLRLAQELRVEGTPALVIGETIQAGAADLTTLESLVAQVRARL